MSTYELGLWISDNQNPPRPLSVIIKTLASDGYILRSASAGKRAGLWTITPRGSSSLCSRPEKCADATAWLNENPRSEEHTSELQSLMRISYAVFCLKKKKKTNQKRKTQDSSKRQ